jgi:DNA/RNA-binding domain of Phe-tRNA-synthetase-like protein
VIDAERAVPPYRLAVVPEKSRYVFNPSGQELDLKGLLCLWDAVGPCGSPVKDSQRTKTDLQTRKTLCLIWGCAEFPERVEQALQDYLSLLSGWPCRLTPLL